MLNMDEINAEIEKLENCDHTTYELCQKLAILYTVKDHYEKKYMNNNTPSMRNTMSAMGMGTP